MLENLVVGGTMAARSLSPLSSRAAVSLEDVWLVCEDFDVWMGHFLDLNSLQELMTTGCWSFRAGLGRGKGRNPKGRVPQAQLDSESAFAKRLQKYRLQTGPCDPKELEPDVLQLRAMQEKGKRERNSAAV